MGSEAMIVDLGCGDKMRGDVRIDRTKHGTTATHVCWLGFEPIPLDDGVADTVIAHDILEHVPWIVYGWKRGKWVEYRPGIFLMDEIWRILKPDGLLDTHTPVAPNPEAFQDPTHASFWTPLTPLYFTREHGLRERYAIKACFRIVGHQVVGSYLNCAMRAVK